MPILNRRKRAAPRQCPAPIAFMAALWLLALPVAFPVPSAGFNRETPVVRAVRTYGPAVVNVGSRQAVHRNPFPGFRMDPFFEEFFRDFFEPGQREPYRRNSLGSGVIIDGEKGLILTNAHVVAGAGSADAITVTLQDEREFDARVTGMDAASDLALLQIETEQPLPEMTMGDSDHLMIGETVIAIGNPFGFSHTVTTGVVSARNRSIRTEDRIYHNFIQTDASINPGNSGGPLLDINGELIGINTAIYAKAQGIGFAIPINSAKRIIADLIEYGEVIPGWLGLIVQELDFRLARYANLPRGTGGVVIKAVEAGSPARKAGLQSGDILLSVDGRALASVADYRMAMRTIPSGETVRLTVWRAGREQTLQARTKTFPPDRVDDLARQLFGIRAKDHPNLNGIVITDVERGSHLAGIGVRPGDVIRALDDTPIRNMADFRKTVVKYRNRSSAVVLLQRKDRAYYITVNL